jgi:hypothetical protein
MAKLVYLDSNDFSDLSKPEEELSDGDKRVLETLRNAHRRGEAIFYVSPIHISEAVHASEAHKEAAARRALLMRELAMNNFLRFPTEICQIELTNALSGREKVGCSFEEIASKPNEWFGTTSSDLKENRKDIRVNIEQAVSGQPRSERRRLLSQLNPARKGSHKLIRSMIQESLRNEPPKYPFSLLDQDTVISWYLGKVSDAELGSSIIKLVSDPYLLFNHLIDEVGHRDELYNLVRDQGRKWGKLVEGGMSEFAPIFHQAHTSGHQVDLRSILSQIATPEFWRKVVGALAERDLTSTDIQVVMAAKEKSPSTALFTHAILESLLVRLQSTRSRAIAGTFTPAEVKPSDYGDFMHSTYAPYFDVFRCDSSFAAVLKAHPLVREKVAGKRRDLLDVL